jgi:uncharacterized membrane protein YgcG
MRCGRRLPTSLSPRLPRQKIKNHLSPYLKLLQFRYRGRSPVRQEAVFHVKGKQAQPHYELTLTAICKTSQWRKNAADSHDCLSTSLIKLAQPIYTRERVFIGDDKLRNIFRITTLLCACTCAAQSTTNGPVPAAIQQMPARFTPPTPGCGYTGKVDCFYAPKDNSIGAMTNTLNASIVPAGYPAPPTDGSTTPPPIVIPPVGGGGDQGGSGGSSGGGSDSGGSSGGGSSQTPPPPTFPPTVSTADSTTPATNAIPSASWITVGKEGDTIVALAGQSIRYGSPAGPYWAETWAPTKVIAANTSFVISNDYFGGDPLPNVVKVVQVLVVSVATGTQTTAPPPPATQTYACSFVTSTASAPTLQCAPVQSATN